MSLMRRIWLLLLLTLAFAVVGAVSVNLLSARALMQGEMQARQLDSAREFALALSQQRGDRVLMDLLLAAEFDTGTYRQIRFDPLDGSAPFVHTAVPAAGAAPGWFVRLLAIDPVAARAPVSDGTRALGTIEMWGSVSPVVDAVWRSSLRAAAAMGALGLLGGLAGAWAVLRIHRRLAAAVAHANALLEGRFVVAPEPAPQELRLLTRAMNASVARQKSSFDAQAAQLEQLSRQAQRDPLTGLANRGHFLGLFEAGLQREDGAEQCGLVLLRLRDLRALNRILGHAATDRVLGAIAHALQPYGERVPGCLLGRLNGADFAMCLPVGGVAHETAQALAAALRAVLPGFGQGVAVALGAVELRREIPLADALAAADEALARAEARGAYEVELASQTLGRPGLGESAWRKGLGDALTKGRAKLFEFPVVDAAGGLVHLECPLRLQLEPDGAFESAARWLPLALRSRMTARIDARAVALALDAIAHDGRPRCVNLAPASLADSAFAARLRTLLFAAPRAARKLLLEVAEAAAVEHFELVQELARQLRPCGVRLGLEHVGPRLGQIEHLFELGLDFVKLGAAVTRGAGGDLQRRSFVRSSIELLHGLSLQVYAEGVNDDDDAQALWACRVDGITGPWAGA